MEEKNKNTEAFKSNIFIINYKHYKEIEELSLKKKQINIFLFVCYTYKKI